MIDKTSTLDQLYTMQKVLNARIEFYQSFVKDDALNIKFNHKKEKMNGEWK